MGREKGDGDKNSGLTLASAIPRLRALTDELERWLGEVEIDSGGEVFSADEEAALVRTVDQVSAATDLLALSADRTIERGCAATGWALLDLARVQLAHAANEVIGREEARARFGLPPFAVMWLLARDLAGGADVAGEVVDLGAGPGRVPDLRPVTALEMPPLQFLAATAMAEGEILRQEMPGRVQERVAYREYLAVLVEVAVDLLVERAAAAADAAITDIARRYAPLADGVRRIGPGVEEVFGVGPAAGAGLDEPDVA